MKPESAEEIIAPGVAANFVVNPDYSIHAVRIKIYVSDPSRPTREAYYWPDDLDAICDWWQKKRQAQAISK